MYRKLSLLSISCFKLNISVAFILSYRFKIYSLCCRLTLYTFSTSVKTGCLKQGLKCCRCQKDKHLIASNCRSNVHTHLRTHFKDDGRINHIFSSKVLRGLRKVAAWKLHSVIQKLHLMRKLQILEISWKTYTN